jgi:hypothetical protein
LQRKRIGEYIDGVFHTHAEVAVRREQEERMRREAEDLEVRRCAAANLIQRVYLGHKGRQQARTRRADISGNAKSRAAYARRRTKRGSLYGCDGVPAAMEPKLRLLGRLLVAPPNFSATRRVTSVHRRRASLSGTVRRASVDSLSAEDRAILQRKMRLV